MNTIDNDADSAVTYTVDDTMMIMMTRMMMVMQVEKQRVTLQHELDDLSQRLDEAGGATQAQVIYIT